MGEKVDLLLRNARVIMKGAERLVDIAVSGETIQSVSLPGKGPHAHRVIDADGLLAVPGGVDVHTHPYYAITKEVRSRDDFRSCTLAAAFGGTTSIIDFVFQRGGGSALDEVRRRHLEDAEGKSVLDYGFHCCLTDETERTLSDMEPVVSYGIPSFKVFTVNPGVRIRDGFLVEIMRRCKDLGATMLVHAENAEILEHRFRRAEADGKTAPRFYPCASDALVEAEAIDRVIFFAERLGTRVYFVHVSTRDGVDLIRKAKRRGLPITGETCTHYLSLTDDVYQRDDAFKFLMSPPIKGRQDQDALWAGIADRTLTVISSDHCAHDRSIKQMGTGFTDIPKGVAGVEARIPVTFSLARKRSIPLSIWVDAVSSSPARHFGMYPQKGAIHVGSDADLVLIDPDKEWTISSEHLHMGVDFTVFDGMTVDCQVQTVIVGGRLLIHDRVLVDERRGRFLRRVPCAGGSGDRRAV